MIDIELHPEVGCCYYLDLQEGSVNYVALQGILEDYSPMPDPCYGYYYAGSKHFTQRPDHTCLRYQIFITHSGQGCLSVGGKEHIVGPDTIAFFDLSQAHRYETCGSHWEYEWVNFITTPICDYYNTQINSNGFTIHGLHNDTRIPAIMQEIRSCTMHVGLHESVQAGVRILDLLDSLCTMVKAKQQKLCRGYENVISTINYIDEHYAEEISVEQLAEMAFLSKFHYIRVFTSVKGLTPHQYLINVRLNHARSLLISTALSIETIGYQVGYGGGRNFIRAFKQATGVTPDKYRYNIGTL